VLNFADQMKQIGDLAAHVSLLVETREYDKAHIALDDMEIKINAVHRHIGKLELVGRVLPSPSQGGPVGDIPG